MAQDLPLTEFEPMTEVIHAIPRRIQRGLFTHWVHWTCIDVTREYIAMGSDSAVIFLLDRSTNNVTRLFCKIHKNEVITTIKLCHSVDYVLAVGTVKGSVYIFQLPSILPGRPKELRQFLVPTMHHSPIKTLAWSQNAMKLYTGDENGVVACTELNYDSGECKSYLVCKEPHEIVQLDYMYRTLLVSTRFRCLLCFTDDNNRIQQIGTKDRKTLGPFGATFVPGILQTSDSIIFTVRPGLRVWRAGLDGVVQSTFMFRDIIVQQGAVKDMDMLEDTAQPLPVNQDEKQFGPLLIYEGTQLVTWFNTAVYVLDPGTGSVAAFHQSLGQIRNVSVCEDEILVLRDHHERPIVRIAKKPDLKLSPQANSVSLALPTITPSISGAAPVQLLQDTASQMSQSLVTVFNQVSEKIQSVQEGERTPAAPPPWGYHGNMNQSQDSIENPDSAKESPATSQPTSPQDSETIILNPPGSQPTSQDPQGIASTGPLPASPALNTQPPAMSSESNPSVDAVKAKSNAKPARKQKKEKVVNLDDSQDLVVVHKKVKKKKKPADAGSVSSLELNQASPLPGSPALAHRNMESEAEPTPPDPNDDIAPVVAENPKWTKMLEKLEQELTSLPTGPGLDDARNSDEPKDKVEASTPDPKETKTPESKQTTDHVSKAPNLSNTPPSSETLSSLSASQTASKESFEITDASSSTTGMASSIFDAPTSPKHVPARAMESEDFYSKYKCMSPSSPPGCGISIEDAIEAPRQEKQKEKKEDSSEVKKDTGLPTIAVNDWLEFVLPGSIQSLCVNDRHVWIVDNTKKVHYSHLLGPGLRWEELKEPAELLTTSPSGGIVWKVNKGSLYAATNVTAKRPEGSKWIEVAQSVSQAVLDDSVGWYCKQNGDVFIHKGLSRSRPLYRGQRVTYDAPILSITAYNGVVWALSKDRKLLVRTGVTARTPEGSDWEPLKGCGDELLVSAVELGTQQTGWVVDVVGRLWFTIGVTPSKPHGIGEWWQVPLSEFLMEEARALSKIKNALSAPAALAGLIQRSDSGGLMAARVNGLWFSSNFNKNILLACKMGVEGHRWDVTSPTGIVTSIKWHSVVVEAAHNPSDLVWAQQPNASLFVFSLDKPEPREVSPPLEAKHHHQIPKPFKVMAACRDAVWGLMEGGEVFIRTEISSHCPQGVKWSRLDLSQLGRNTRFIHISLGDQNSWAVSSDGTVFLRIGVLAPSQVHLNPVWVPVEGTTNSSGAKFVKVYSSSNDWMVWAVDNKGAVYVRKGITDSFPLGTHWDFVPGPPAQELTVSERMVYAVSAANGELLVRYGISKPHPEGSCWKKIPGAMQSLSVTPLTDELWGLNLEQQMCRRSTKSLELKPVLETLRATRSRGQSVEEDWEML